MALMSPVQAGTCLMLCSRMQSGQEVVRPDIVGARRRGGREAFGRPFNSEPQLSTIQSFSHWSANCCCCCCWLLLLLLLFLLLFLLLLMLLLLFLPRSLFFLSLRIQLSASGSCQTGKQENNTRLFFSFVIGRGYTRGEPWSRKKPTTFRNCGVH